MMLDETINDSNGEIKVSFGYNCNSKNDDSYSKTTHIDIPSAGKLRRASRSFSCLSGAALSANATLANTNICNGLIGAEILPTLDSPTSFRRVPSSPSLTKIDLLSASFQNSMSNLSFSPHSPRETLDFDAVSFKPSSVPTRSESFLNAMEVLQIAGGLQVRTEFRLFVLRRTGLVLLVLLHGNYLYLLNIGDSRAVLATYDDDDGNMKEGDGLRAVQLTESHTVDNDLERIRLLNDHPDDPSTIVGWRVKGKLKVTRAFGVGYLKKKNMNDALMGILRVRNLISPPYVSSKPSLGVHEVSTLDHFVVLGSDGLFDFFSNNEVVKLVHSYILRHPSGDPAKYLVEQLVARAADSAGFSMEELMSIPAGRRRKYHDDVTVIVIILGNNNRTSKASTCL
ncbi:UNVERIFIED_CONTAM: putative protein phosphatase 2C 40 [Sesamum calycinum]|uniref:PPM-type phosphatase domain-containing protein n=1 Tax=Sesamum calycinum TaxID=2727403 RepID=A0AAW2QK83_9LAMI